VRAKIIKVLEDKIWNYFQDLMKGKILMWTQSYTLAYTHIERVGVEGERRKGSINKFDYIRIKNFCLLEMHGKAKDLCNTYN
jgi:hypothetical protein